MAEGGRLLKKLPYAEPSLRTPTHGSDPTVKRAGVPHGTASHLEASGPGGGRLGTWIRVVLGVLIGIGVAPGVWPYSHGCGLRVMFYLLGVATVIAAGVWAGVSSWRRRLGFAHVISQVLIIWGVLLMTREVLPRVGAKPEAPWLCPDVPQPR